MSKGNGEGKKKASQKGQLTLDLRPLVMAAVRREAVKWKMPAKDWLETLLHAALLHPEGIPVKLHLVAPEPEPVAGAEAEPMLPLGGGLTAFGGDARLEDERQKT